MARDREGTFEPRFIPKHERRFTGFDDKILALYARGMTVREIQGFLAEMYTVEVSPDLISTGRRRVRPSAPTSFSECLPKGRLILKSGVSPR
jgi:transposase-like protein